ncbi:MAG: hypothetical protein Q9159_000681 [Coniocarpon cinnabarinum]
MPRSPHSPRIASAYSWTPESSATAVPPVNTRWRRAMGLLLLAVNIILWTASGFMTSSIFANGEYSKPYLMTYVNTAFFAIPLLPIYIRHAYSHRTLRIPLLSWFYPASTESSDKTAYRPLSSHEESSSTKHASNDLASDDDADTRFLSPSRAATQYNTPRRNRSPTGPLRIDTSVSRHRRVPSANPSEPPDDRLSTRATFNLALRFAPLWFLANWFNSASYSYTSVASSTILVSTSSVFTLIFGAFMKIEAFTLKKMLGVLASLAGVVLISLIDTRRKELDDADRGDFPFKTPAEIVLGDAMALASALVYGLYATILTRTVGADESTGRIHMPLFFGFLGLISILVFWPGLPILSLAGVETLALPPNAKAFWIVFFGAVISLVSDMCWAYAVLLTSPLVVTMGLALTIPLSLLGQVVLNGQYASWGIWVGAVVIVAGFVVVNWESEGDGVEKVRRSARPEQGTWDDGGAERR